MQPNYMTVMEIYSKQRRPTVPLFQRPYVWDRETEWEPLWGDIHDTAERVLNGNGGKIASHFLGTVVLDQAATSASSIECREVIDGQQRLTTLQLALKAAIDAITDLRATVTDDEAGKLIDLARGQLEPLVANPAVADEQERYKVWPTNEDRAAFREVMDAESATGPRGTGSRMAKAHGFFVSQFRDWLSAGEPGPRARALANALKDHMKLIVLDLDESDEPQAIFETLNAHGTPLLPADLIKNWLLWEGTRQGLAIDTLYRDFWQPFDRDDDYWRVKVGTGHAARPRIDTFLQNWLTRRTREAISPKHLYSQFLRFVQQGDARSADGVLDLKTLMADIAADARRYRIIDAPAGKTRFDAFLRRLHAIDVVVFHPLILEVMGREGSDDVDRDKFAETLESYLVRRMVCNLQTRGYGALTLDLLRQVARLNRDQPVAAAITEALSEANSSVVVWPDDDKFRAEWVGRKFYGRLRQPRILMLLSTIEEHYQGENTKAEPVIAFDFAKLEIEHIMPQKWDEHWPLPPNVTHDEREWALQGIGNLTLISAPLNKDLSHGPWISAAGGASKRHGLQQSSKLELNRRLLERYPSCWDESAIRSRALELFEVASKIWPKADDLRSGSSKTW